MCSWDKWNPKMLDFVTWLLQMWGWWHCSSVPCNFLVPFCLSLFSCSQCRCDRVSETTHWICNWQLEERKEKAWHIRYWAELMFSNRSLRVFKSDSWCWHALAGWPWANHLGHVCTWCFPWPSIQQSLEVQRRNLGLFHKAQRILFVSGGALQEPDQSLYFSALGFMEARNKGSGQLNPNLC